MLKSLIMSAVHTTTIIASVPAILKIEMTKAMNNYELAMIKEQFERELREKELRDHYSNTWRD